MDRPTAAIPNPVFTSTTGELRDRVLGWVRAVEPPEASGTFNYPYSHNPQMAGEEYYHSSLELREQSHSVTPRDSSSLVPTDEGHIAEPPKLEQPELEIPPPAYFPPHTVARD